MDVRLSEAETAIVQAAILAQLEDPESAFFGQLRVQRMPEEDMADVAFCGLVKTKNSNGVYADNVPFSGLMAGGALLFEPYLPDSASRVRMVHKTCDDLGIPLSLVP